MQEIRVEGEPKCVMVLNGELPAGLLANTAGVLSVTLGRRVADILGPDVKDGAGESHAGLTKLPMPVLRATAEEVREIRARATSLEGVLTVDVTDAAQSSKNYEDYERKISATAPEDLQYLGVALYGKKRPINRLTGSLSLLK